MLTNAFIKEDFNEGLLRFTNKAYEKSIESFSRVLEADPECELAYISRGAAYIEAGKFHEAIDDFDKGAELNSVNARVYHLRGIAYAKLGEHEKSLHDFDKAIELNPEYGAAFLSRANVHSELGHKEQADEDMETVALLEEKNLQTYADENNVWRSRHLRLEAEGILAEIDR